ncbi:hypothetical protein ACE6H2_014467 [Prunus campanulata]
MYQSSRKSYLRPFWLLILNSQLTAVALVVFLFISQLTSLPLEIRLWLDFVVI